MKNILRSGRRQGTQKQGYDPHHAVNSHREERSNRSATSKVFINPQVEFNKNYLSVIAEVGQTVSDFVVVTNTGNTAVYYEWTKVKRGDFLEAKQSDFVPRFYCHYPKSVLLPNETKSFYFTFRSERVGIFTEEWEFITDPPLITPLPQFKLLGHSIREDEFVQGRNDLLAQLTESSILNNVGEIIRDIVGDVRTPTPPLPDLNDPEVCRVEFEEKNKDLRLWYHPVYLRWFRELEQMIYTAAEIPEEDQYWDTSIASLENNVSLVEDDTQRENLTRRLASLVNLSKSKPYERSIAYNPMRDILVGVANKIPDISDQIRKDKEMCDYEWRAPPDEKELTEEEYEAALNEIKTLREKEKTTGPKKKKAKSPEDEQKENDDWKERVAVEGAKLALQAYDGGFNQEEPLLQLKLLLENRQRVDEDTFEQLSRKHKNEDYDIEGKRVLLRLDLDVELSPVEYEQTEALSESGIKSPRSKAGDDASVAEDKIIKPRTIIDTTKLDACIETLKFCVDHLAGIIIIAASLGDPTGESRPENSLRPIADFFREKLEHNVVFEEERIELDDLEQRMEEGTYPENCILFLENLFFHPHEFGGLHTNSKGQLVRSALEDRIQFGGYLSSLCDAYINDSVDQTLTELASVVHINVDYRMMGSNLCNEVSSFVNIFKEPRRPLVLIIGGFDHLNQLLLAYSMLDLADHIILVGEVALAYVVHHYGVKYSKVAFPSTVQYMIRQLAEKSEENEVKVFAPIDFQIVNQTEAEKLAEEQRNVKAQNLLQAEENKSKGSVAGEQGETAEIAIEEDPLEWLTCAQANNLISVFAPANLKHKALPSVKESIQEENVENDFQQSALSGRSKAHSIKGSDITITEHQAETDRSGGIPKSDTRKDDDENESEQSQVEKEEEEVIEIPENHVIVEYGEATKAYIERQILEATSVFWVGSASVHPKSAADDLNRYLVDRFQIEREHKEIIIYGQEAEEITADMLQRFIDEAVRAKTMSSRTADPTGTGDADDEFFDDADDDDEDTDEEEGSNKIPKTDVSNICTQYIRDSVFNLGLLQGKRVPGIELLGEHPKPEPKKEEDDLSILDEI